MFKFLFGKKGEPVTETQRQTVERAMGEINEIVAAMPNKPQVTVNMTTGIVEYVLPDQMPDEALALPAPDTSDVKESSEADDIKSAA